MKWRLSVIFLCFALVATGAATGQGVTTGEISGMVTDENGNGLPGATVTAVHQPTGTAYTRVANAQGRYHFLAVRVGGPYTVSAQLEGFKPQQKTDLFVELASDLQVNFTLELAFVEEDL